MERSIARFRSRSNHFLSILFARPLVSGVKDRVYRKILYWTVTRFGYGERLWWSTYRWAEKARPNLDVERCWRGRRNGGGKKERYMPWHSVRLNLLTRFQAALAALQPSFCLPPSLPPCSSLFFILLYFIFFAFCILLFFLFPQSLPRIYSSRRSFMITSTRLRPSNPSPWNLGWHLVNRERRRRSPFCTNFGLPAAREAATPSLKPWTSFLLVHFRLTRARDSSRLLSFSARRIDYGSSPWLLTLCVYVCVYVCMYVRMHIYGSLIVLFSPFFFFVSLVAYSSLLKGFAETVFSFRDRFCCDGRSIGQQASFW